MTILCEITVTCEVGIPSTADNVDYSDLLQEMWFMFLFLLRQRDITILMRHLLTYLFMSYCRNANVS